MNKEKNILVILTGGTICSSVNNDGHRYSDAKNIKIIENFKNGSSPVKDCINFHSEMPLNILSENMNIDTWNILIDFFKKSSFEKYDGIIILHGTDTLAYTASLLSVALSGIKLPVILVSAQLPLSVCGTNGNANFKAAAELIYNGIKPNVYAVYKNSDDNIYLHYGSQLLGCANYSNDFYSRNNEIISCENATASGKAFETGNNICKKLNKLTPCVLRVIPYAGLNYNVYNLTDIKAVIHNTYHSETVCINSSNSNEYSYSAIEFLNKCKEKNIPFITSPCSKSAFKYETTGKLLNAGAASVYGMTDEACYTKALIGCALGLEGEELTSFMSTAVNHEFIG